MDKIEAIRALVTVVHEGSFTRAADKLNTSPQLVSKYVNQLESALGVRLLSRTTRRVSQTEAGERYVQRAQQLLVEFDELDNQMSDMQVEARGRLRISAPVSFATRHLTALLCEFQQQNTKVSIDLQLNDRKVDVVEEGFDVALRIGNLNSFSLVAKKICPIHMVYCASPAYLETHGTPQSLKDLKAHRFLSYQYNEVQNIGDGQQHSQTEGAFTTNNGDVLVQAAQAGAGVVMQPTFIAFEALREGSLKTILDGHEPPPLALYAVYAHRKLLASKVRNFLDFIGDYYGEVPEWDSPAQDEGWL